MYDCTERCETLRGRVIEIHTSLLAIIYHLRGGSVATTTQRFETSGDLVAGDRVIHVSHGLSIFGTVTVLAALSVMPSSIPAAQATTQADLKSWNTYLSGIATASVADVGGHSASRPTMTPG